MIELGLSVIGGIAIATYTNKTGKTINTKTIKCILLGKVKKLGVNERFFSVNMLGNHLGPGFSETVEVPAELNGVKMKSMQCSVHYN